MRNIEGIWAGRILTPTPTPSITPTLSITPTITPTPGASVTPTVTPSATPTFQWIAINYTDPGSPAFNGSAYAGSLYFLIYGENLYKSSNISSGFAFFKPLSGELNSTPGHFEVVAGIFGVSNRVYFFCEPDYSPSDSGIDIFYSDDGAVTFNKAITNATGNYSLADGRNRTATKNGVVIISMWTDNGNEYLYSSDNGAHWFNTNSGTLHAAWNSVAYGNPSGDMWVATGYRQDSSTTLGIAYTTNPLQGGATNGWTGVAVNSEDGYANCAYGNNTFVAVGINQISKMFISAASNDGVNWTQTVTPFSIVPNTCIFDPMSQNFIVGVDNNNNLMYHSNDGINWFTKTAPDLYVDTMVSGANGPVGAGFGGQIQRFGF